MTNEQVKDVCKKYDKALSDLGVESERESENSGSLKHLRWMCSEVISFIDVGKIEKAHRWLGFLQGAFWVKEIFNIEQLKDDNRTEEKVITIPEFIYELNEFQEKLLSDLKIKFLGHNVEFKRGERIFIDGNMIKGLLCSKPRLPYEVHLISLVEEIKIQMKLNEKEV